MQGGIRCEHIFAEMFGMERTTAKVMCRSRQIVMSDVLEMLSPRRDSSAGIIVPDSSLIDADVAPTKAPATAARKMKR